MSGQKHDEALVRKVIRMHRSGCKTKVIGRRTGLTRVHIWRIVNGKVPLWKHLLDEQSEGSNGTT